MDPQDTSTDDHSTSMIESHQSHESNRQSSSSFLKSKRKSNMYDSFSFNNNNNAQSMLENVGRNEQSSEYIGLFQKPQDRQQRLKQVFVLQQYLQKQYLMLVKEQTQKSKFIKQIEDEMKHYYSLLIQMKDRNKTKDSTGQGNTQGVLKKGFQFTSLKKPLNRIVTDDGFDNCSNFIKQIIIHTSRNYQVAIILLMNCTITYDQNEKGSIFIKDYLLLVDLFVNILYERVSQTDPFLKEITKLVCELVARLPKLRDEEELGIVEVHTIQHDKVAKHDRVIKTNSQKVLKIFATFMQKQQIQDYFEILSNNILKKIQKISFQRAQIRSRVGISLHQSNSILTENSLDLDKQFTDPTSSFGFKLQQNWMEYVKPHESFNEQKRALAMSFLSQVYSQADLCPIGLKIVLKYFYQKQSQHYQHKYPQKTKPEIKQLTSLRLWQLIQQQYINKLSPEMSKQSILFKQMSTYQRQIVEDIKSIVMGFFNCKRTQGYLGDDELCDAYRKSKKFINKVVEKLLSFNQEKYDKFVETIKQNVLQNVEMSMKKVKSQVGNKKGEKQKNVNEIQSSFVSQSQSALKENNNNDNNKKPQQKKHIKQPSPLSPQLLKIYGGCISFKQLHILLQSLRRLLPVIPNQRIINRTQRIFDMSPQLQFLTKHKLVKHPNQIQFMYIILLQHELDQLISIDYRVLYTKEYENDKVKSMIRQIVCQLKLKQLSKRVNKRDFVHKKKVNKSEFQLQDLKSFKKGGVRISPQKAKQKPTDQNKLLINLLQKISDECSKSVQGTQVQYSLHKGISLQLLKKIKYLLYLFKNKSSQLNEQQILSQMLNEVKTRSEKMRRIYQHTKFGLLAAIGNIKHYKNLLISKKEIQMKIQSRVEKILLLESVHLSLCITSPYTRSHPQFGLKHQHIIAYENIQHSSFMSSKSPQKQRQNQSPSKLSSSSFNKQKSSQQLPEKFQQIKNPKQSNIFFEPFNKYKYRISNADDIVICSTQDCIHKDNIFMGLSYHLNSIKEFIEMFSALREVGENLFFAGYVVPQQLAIQMDKKLHNELKTFTPITHPLANLFTSKKYQKLHYSIDKINSTFYEFIDYIMQQKIPQILSQSQKSISNKHQMTEIKRVLKDILLRGIHSKLVKRIENNIKVNLIENLIRSPQNINFNTTSNKNNSKLKTKQQSHRINCLINHGLDVPNSQPHILTNFVDNNDQDQDDLHDIGRQKKDYDDGSFIEEELIGNGDRKINKESVSEEIRVWDDQELRSSTGLVKRPHMELPENRRGAGNRQQSKSNKKNIQHQRQQQQVNILQKDTSIYQSRNDQIFLYQIQRIHNSKRFQLFNRKNNHNTNSSQQLQTTQNMKQLQQVCARCKLFVTIKIDIRGINKKQTPEDKIQLLKQISEIFKLVGGGRGDDSNSKGSNRRQGLNRSRKTINDSGKKSQQYQVQRQKQMSAQKSSHLKEQMHDTTHDGNEQKHHYHHNYTIETLIFRSLVIAQPPNFITNLAFIQMFLHKDKMLSNQGKILNQFKNIARQIFQFKGIEKYLCMEGEGKSGENGESTVDFNNDGEFNGLLTRIKDQSNREMYLP